MIDSISFQGVGNPAGVDLNSVVNGVGIALKKFEPSIEDVRHSNNDNPYSAGVVPSPTVFGRQLVELEGDIMHNTPTGYWQVRTAFAKHFISYYPINTIGLFAVQLTGMPEVIGLDASVVGAPQIPVGLAGATISPWRLVLAGNDPWFKGVNQQSQSGLANVNISLTNFGIATHGNAPSWPTFIITGPITNPNILWQGNTIFSMTGTIAAGTTVTVDMRARTAISGGGSNLYGSVDTVFGWIPLDPRNTVALGKNVRLNGSSTTGATTLQTQWYNSYTLA